MSKTPDSRSNFPSLEAWGDELTLAAHDHQRSRPPLRSRLMSTSRRTVMLPLAVLALAGWTAGIAIATSSDSGPVVAEVSCTEAVEELKERLREYVAREDPATGSFDLELAPVDTLDQVTAELEESVCRS